MKQLLSALGDIPEYRALTTAVDNGGCPVAFSGLSAVHRAHFAAGLHQELERPVVVVCADEGEAQRTRCPPGSSPSTTPPWCPGSTSTGGFPCSGRWRRGSAPCWCVRWRPSSSAPSPRPC
ncbi:hypothetical protein [Flavonifractor sp. An306]|uniref:hypothetical protein n=1 Tax=Flavonifractor sp. An306 TaxID=1965629 RepID=UPI0026256C56|nr:hypothetical protein [Flavonifractor sp. An306]